MTLTIGKAEALILFELLADFHKEPHIVVHDNAERLSLMRLGGVLEKALPEPFLQDYEQIVAVARQQLNEAWGTYDPER